MAFEYCQKCQIWAVHRYCLEKVPPFDEDVVWFCKDCEPKPTSNVAVAESSSPTLKKKRTKTKRKNKKQAGKPHTNNKNNNMDDETASSDSELKGQDSPFLQTMDVEHSENHDNDDQLEANIELDGDLPDKNTSIKDDVAATDAVIPVQEDFDVRAPKVSGQVKHASGTESLRTKTRHPEKDDYLNNPAVTSDHERREKDGGFPNEKGEFVNTQRSLVAVEDPLPELNYPPAQPIMEPIWIGSFHLRDRDFGTIEGIMAHLSTLACPKVCDAAKSLPVLLSLELLPKHYMWPKSFEKSGPMDYSIALYFFPNNEETEKIFDSLVDKMMSRHLGMKATLQEAELLIFTSSLLPLEFRRFQSKFYLWGVFRRKQTPYLAKVDPAVAKDHMDSLTWRSSTSVSPRSNNGKASNS